MKLSHSAIEKYKICPRMYELHYIKALKPTYTFSALFFGSAIDAALNEILLKKGDGKDTFLNAMKIVDINGKKVEVKTSRAVNYYASDLDISILSNDDIKDILNYANDDSKDINSFIEDCATKIKDKVGLSEEEQLLKNYITYKSLINKGLLFLDAYKADIIPQIEEVGLVQQEINLPNKDGDFINGFIDFTARFKGEDFFRVMDNKTSSEAYSMKNIENSQQLALYSEYMMNRNVGYAVLNKKLRKKSPIVKTQLIFGTISEELTKKTFDTVGETLYNIKNGNFEQRLESCYQYGRKCPYFNYCRDENDLRGLEQTKELYDRRKKD